MKSSPGFGTLLLKGQSNCPLTRGKFNVDTFILYWNLAKNTTLNAQGTMAIVVGADSRQIPLLPLCQSLSAKALFFFQQGNFNRVFTICLVTCLEVFLKCVPTGTRTAVAPLRVEACLVTAMNRVVLALVQILNIQSETENRRG